MMRNLFADAASLLIGEHGSEATDAPARRLLENLGYVPRAPGTANQETRHRARLLQAAAQLIRVFELNAPDAPALVALGAELDPGLADPMHAGCSPVSVSGVGPTVQDAFQGCVGEAVEYLSQLQTAADVLCRTAPTTQAVSLDLATQALMAKLDLSRGADLSDLSWHATRRLVDGVEVLLPTDLCLRRPPAMQEFVPPFPLSIGSAAGVSWEAAALHGLLELVERDAASLWWHGGRRGCAVPSAIDTEAADLLQMLRAGAKSSRRSWLLDITTDIGIPCVVALSCRPDGRGFAFGMASRLSLHTAARSAISELCQMELAYAVVEAKHREHGDKALNARDRVHVQRARVIDAEKCALLHPAARERIDHPVIDATDIPAALQSIVGHLHQRGIVTYGLDLTRTRFAIPVARMIAPGLQAEPSQFVTARLADTIARTGGGTTYTGGVPLI